MLALKQLVRRQDNETELDVIAGVPCIKFDYVAKHLNATANELYDELDKMENRIRTIDLNKYFKVYNHSIYLTEKACKMLSEQLIDELDFDNVPKSLWQDEAQRLVSHFDVDVFNLFDNFKRTDKGLRLANNLYESIMAHKRISRDGLTMVGDSKCY